MLRASRPLHRRTLANKSNIDPQVAYRDLREWIEAARKLGEIREVKGLSWQQDIGMVAEMALHDETAPCFIFEDVPGSIKGSRVLVNFFGGQRKNMTLGFPTDLSKIELSDGFRRHFMSDLKRIPPKFVNDGPIFENVMKGDDIDVTMFPTPQWHEPDGGRYIGTGSFDITRDPDEGWVNCGTYRVMIHDAKSVGLYISPGKHGRIMRDKYMARNEPMPVAIVVGGDPMTFLMACSELPYGVSEYELVGGIRGAPVEVIKGPVTGLPIPANAEIVIEGFVQPGNERIEGPFGEWTGYYASDVRPEPVLDIKAIYYRNNPIILGCPPQRPPDEIARYRAVVRSGLLQENIEKAGVPGDRRRLGARSRQRAPPARRRDHAALSRTRPAGRPHRKSVSRRRLLRALRHRGGRRYRCFQSRGADLGDAHALGSGDLHRHHPQRLEHAARSAHRAGAQGGGRQYQQPGDHRCVSAVPLARQVSPE